MTFHEIFRRACWRNPDKTFLFCDNAEVTYADADRLSDAMASAFREWGLQPKDRVGVIMANSVDAVLVCLASWKVGLLPVMVDPRAAPDDLEYYATLTSPAVFVHDDELASDVAKFAAGTRCVPRTALARLKPRTEHTEIGRVDDDTLGSNVSFTTGTTGRPKGVVLAHGPVSLATACIAERMALSRDDVILHPGPLYSSFHLVAMLLPGMHRGATMGLQSEWDPAVAWHIVEKRQVTVFTSYPMILTDFVDHARRHHKRSATLRLAMSGGSTTALEIKRRYRRTLGIPLIESYGQSELGGFFALGDPREALPDDPHSFATGRALADKTVAILDEDGAELPIGESGEIALRGGFMQGYWNAPDQTAHSLRGGWLHSGDVGRMDADGFITLLGRKGDELAYAGRWVFPRELEETLYAHPAVEHAAAIATPEDTLVAYVSLLDSVASAADLQAYVATRLPVELHPVRIEVLDAMPRTASGKLNKSALKARLSAERVA